ncbi:MAG TPA: MBL fold metallo-hydrolase [Terriglobia bacterium]|jgi:glyoxylase-like metal-dependent hydrolase (beta-lactamase superfamily II)
MIPVQTRRGFLSTLALVFAARKAFAFPSQIASAKLTENLTFITGAGGNIVVLSQPEGLLLVNGSSPEMAAELMKYLADQFKGQPVKAVFNTDWHLDHTGSNELFKKAGAKIYAHENTKLWIGADFYSDWDKHTYKPRSAAALPTDTFYTSGKMTFGKEPIEYGYMAQAHTDGDIYVFFPGQNVLAAGDILSVGKYPLLDYVTGGWLGGLQNANTALLKVANAETRIIPGSGPVQTRADLQAQADMCTMMRDRLVKLMRQGMGPADMIASKPTEDFDAKWGNPELFIRMAYRGMWGHVRELGGII